MAAARPTCGYRMPQRTLSAAMTGWPQRTLSAADAHGRTARYPRQKRMAAAQPSAAEADGRTATSERRQIKAAWSVSHRQPELDLIVSFVELDERTAALAGG